MHRDTCTDSWQGFMHQHSGQPGENKCQCLPVNLLLQGGSLCAGCRRQAASAERQPARAGAAGIRAAGGAAGVRCGSWFVPLEHMRWLNPVLRWQAGRRGPALPPSICGTCRCSTSSAACWRGWSPVWPAEVPWHTTGHGQRRIHCQCAIQPTRLRLHCFAGAPVVMDSGELIANLSISDIR